MVKGKLSFHLSDFAHVHSREKAYKIVYTFYKSSHPTILLFLPQSLLLLLLKKETLLFVTVSSTLSVRKPTKIENSPFLSLHTNLMNYYKLQLRTNYSLSPERNKLHIISLYTTTTAKANILTKRFNFLLYTIL